MNLKQQRRRAKKAEKRRKKLQTRKLQLPAGRARCGLPLCAICDPEGWKEFCAEYGVNVNEMCPGCWGAEAREAHVALQKQWMRERKG